MAASVQQGTRVRLDPDCGPPRLGTIALLVWTWRDPTLQRELYALVNWDEGWPSWHWVSDLVAVERGR